MSATIDAVTSANTSASGSTPHTCSGSDRAIYVNVRMFIRGGGQDVDSITYNGVALTRVAQSVVSGGDDRVEIWELVNPPAGTFNVAWTISGATSGPDGRLTIKSFTGVHQTTPSGTPQIASGSSTTPSVTVTGVNSDDIVIDGFACDAGGGARTATMVSQSGRVERDNNNTTGDLAVCSTQTSPSSSEAMDWTYNTTVAWVGAAIAIISAPVGSLGVQPTYQHFPKLPLRQNSQVA